MDKALIQKARQANLAEYLLSVGVPLVRNGGRNKTRRIGYDVINRLVENGLLYQERETNNAVFIIYDEKNNIVGAEVQGISKKRFKGMKTGSKYGYGFNVRFSDNDIFDYALFFESAIDLMSFIDYKMNHEGKSFDKCILVSMAGLKVSVVRQMLKVFRGALKPVTCVDNDSAGREFKYKLSAEGIKCKDRSPEGKYKDWNEQLADMKQNSKPIARLMSEGLTVIQLSERNPNAENRRR